MEIKVMMFGGRRCGKTSVIAAMKNCFQKVFGETTDLDIAISDPETMNIIDQKSNEIAQYFNQKSRSIILDAGKSDDMIEYKMDVSIKDKKGKIQMSIWDYPGEWFIKKSGQDDEWKKHQNKLGNVMKSCNVIMIAIDTVYLMEKAMTHKGDSVGQYNEGRNYCSKIANMIKSFFKVNSGESPKVIMFVPLKCEKYYNRGEMSLVNQRIHTAYWEIFDYVKGVNQNKYEVIISPILTFGKDTVEFSRFEYDEDGEIIIDSETHIPSVSKYIFKNMEAVYSPQFCEQPLLYTLAYLLGEMQKVKEAEKKDASLFKRISLYFMEKYGSFASADDFLKRKDVIKGHLMKNGDGYEICNDPLHFR